MATLFNTVESLLKLPKNTAANWLYRALNDSAAHFEPTITSPILDAVSIGLPVLDVETIIDLEKIGLGDPLFMTRLLNNYLTDGSVLIESITKSLKLKQIETCHDLCHALKGSSLSVGAMQLAQAIDAISLLDSASHSDNVNVALKQLNKDFSNLQQSIKQYLKPKKSNTA